MTTTREPKILGPEHPITIEPAGVRVVARVGAQTVADTTRALTMREASYRRPTTSRSGLIIRRSRARRRL